MKPSRFDFAIPASSAVRTFPSRALRGVAPLLLLLGTLGTANATPKDEAKKHFDRGVVLFENGTFDAALLEFRTSYEEFPTRSAGQNLGVVLKKLGRFLEAEEILTTIRDKYKEMKPEDREFVEKELAEVTSLIGALEVVPSEPDVSIVVDGKELKKGDLKLRINSGTHRVSVFKEGFAAVELSVDVVGGKTARVEGKLKALVRGGRLSVAEDGGAVLDVYVDDRRAGQTPWEGTVEEGRHVVSLRGTGDLGSMPVAVEVKLNQRTKVQLVAEPLECSLRVEPAPASASVVVDGIEVGRGNWQGKVRCGGHQVEIAEEAFVPFKKDVSLAKGAPPVLLVQSLERDLSNPKWQTGKPSHFALSLLLSPQIALGLGGDISSSCTGSCSAGLPFGGTAILRPSYELNGGFGFGLDVGYVYLAQKTADRPATLAPVNIDRKDQGTETFERTFKGPMLGVSVGYEKGEKFLLRGRVGGGITFGNYRAARSGRFQTVPLAEGGVAYDTPLRVERGTTITPTVSLELAAGARLSKSFVLEGGLRGMSFFGLGSKETEWKSNTTVVSGNCTDAASHDDPKKCGGDAKYQNANSENEKLFGSTILVLGPFVGARYEF